MVLISKERAVKEKKDFLGESSVDDGLAVALMEQLQAFHSIDRVPDSMELEEILLAQKAHDVKLIGSRPTYPTGLPKFNPSGASKCEYELYHIANKMPVPRLELYPYHRRWLRNSTLAHEGTQRDLLYMGKVLDNPRFTVVMQDDGLPCWERNMHDCKEYKHNGTSFLLSGMMDGKLLDNETGKTVGFEYKTKNFSVASVGNYKLKDIQEGHKLQAICYSIMFFGDYLEDRTDTVLFLYESVAKDAWNKGADARSDVRTFQVEITLEDRIAVMDKFARVATMTEPPEHDCDNFFCPFK